MYVTRPLSMYKKDPSALSLPPPEGPNSGILVILDEEAEPTCCFGLCKSDELKELPFPQNKNLKTRYSTTSGTGNGSHTHVHYHRVVFIPVLNLPLSSNRYYAIQPRGSHKGEAFTNANEEDLTTCCFCNFVTDRKPEPFHHDNIYQQFEICYRDWGGFYAKSVSPDGYPPEFLSRKGWTVVTETPSNFYLTEALGLDTNLRTSFPDFTFPLSQKTSNPVVVGRWYCPFMFIKEGTPKQQISSSMYYKMTLEQRWEQIFACENDHNEDNVAVVDATVQTVVVFFGGVECMPDENNVADGMMWFRGLSNNEGELGVGLSTLITERMKWEQERFGWVGGNGRQIGVNRVEKFGGVGEWRKFGCYVLVERYALKRMDGRLVLTYDFKHINKIRCKWE
ncbi:uncharacterized protein LOC123214112 [Mangifera indica]|uniref:uncharacterized protein LOC123214112 n=1 Tax=Mangifera indica TaxID=29780 RepID=UPI001CFB01A9|nr:uncharacterized protein LOC123214112 [Mangifera indica]